MKEYNHKEIEKKWQKEWEKENANRAQDNSKKPKYYCLVEFPYPSGDGLHTGHIRSYVAMDIVARKRRAEGYNVLYPIGWDAFGLPTENYAVKTKTPPQVVTKQNTDTFRHQLKSLGLSFDWSREINTTDPKYYKWTQWIFLQLFKHGLAYKKKMPINWCLSCKIGLANEEVVDGACERCGGATEKREKEQWMLAITKYADRLDSDLDTVDYVEKIKVGQRNWIGRSQGAEISFQLTGFSQTNAELTQTDAERRPNSIKVFTTRPDTLFGATYMVLAPEHELIENLKLKIKNWDEVVRYIVQSKKKTEIERTDKGKEKTGVELKGIKAINPANKEKIPIFIADYVLKEYGTGAIMAVPAHDERDYEFAKKFKLPIQTVIEPVTGSKHENEEFRKSIVALVENKKTGKILSVNWGEKLGGNLLVGGGLENSEDIVATATREIQEETGYADITLIATSEKIHHHYFAVSKNVHREIEATGLHFILGSDYKVSQKLEKNEHGKFVVEWLSKEEARNKIKDPLHSYVLEKFIFESAYTGNGILVNSGKFDNLESEEAKKKITKFVGGKITTTYKLRDWVFSRQRYWGEPIPLIFCETCSKKSKAQNDADLTQTNAEGERLNPGWVAVSEKDLPVELPEIEKYEPTDTGESPLASMDSWVKVKCPKCSGVARRETDTMPNWAGSSWYFLRYIDPQNDKVLADRKKLNYFMPIDWYNGGMEHTTLHLLYSRFWHKFLFDIGVVPGAEPYQKRTAHGVILAEGGEKMSKSKGNTVNPDDIVKTFGADTLRIYEMFIGPFDQSVVWSDESIIGPRRFLERVWRLKNKVGGEIDSTLEKVLNRAIKNITEDIEAMGFNTLVSELMILSNQMEKASTIARPIYETFLKLLAPIAPHIAEEIWHLIGNGSSIHNEAWPAYDSSKLEDLVVTIVVQINGKIRGEFEAARGTDENEIKSMALKLPSVKLWLKETPAKRIIYVKDKLVSIVV
ncbi:MAG: class I tRNA ligase family protein [Patescibacteria group bacterium]